MANVYTHINTSATTVVSVNPGAILTRVAVNSPGTSWGFQIFDNTAASGPVIANVTAASSAIGSYEYDITVNTGITLVTAGTTAGDLTVVWR